MAKGKSAMSDEQRAKIFDAYEATPGATFGSIAIVFDVGADAVRYAVNSERKRRNRPIATKKPAYSKSQQDIALIGQSYLAPITLPTLRFMRPLADEAFL